MHTCCVQYLVAWTTTKERDVDMCKDVHTRLYQYIGLTIANTRHRSPEAFVLMSISHVEFFTGVAYDETVQTGFWISKLKTELTHHYLLLDPSKGDGHSRRGHFSCFLFCKFLFLSCLCLV